MLKAWVYNPRHAATRVDYVETVRIPQQFRQLATPLTVTFPRAAREPAYNNRRRKFGRPWVKVVSRNFPADSEENNEAPQPRQPTGQNILIRKQLFSSAFKSKSHKRHDIGSELLNSKPF
jgi:hypothetical protein